MSKPRERLLIISIVALVVAAAGFFGYYLLSRYAKKNVTPVIICASDELRVSVDAPKEDLLIGVTAMDVEDGDLTSSIVIESISQFVEKGKCTITYAVCDSGNRVATVPRTLYYTDYYSPRFRLTGDLIYPAGTSVKPLASIKAFDCLEGDISNRISMTAVDTEEIASADSREVEFRVMNSRGDVSTFRANIVIQEKASPNTPEIRLGLPEDGENEFQYLIYVKAGERVDPFDYIKQIRLMNVDYTLEEFIERFGSSGISADFDPDTQRLSNGLNIISIYCEHEGHVGSTTLYVIVED